MRIEGRYSSKSVIRPPESLAAGERSATLGIRAIRGQEQWLGVGVMRRQRTLTEPYNHCALRARRKEDTKSQVQRSCAASNNS